MRTSNTCNSSTKILVHEDSANQCERDFVGDESTDWIWDGADTAEWHRRFDALFNHRTTRDDREDDGDDGKRQNGEREQTFCTLPGRDCQKIISERGRKREGTFASESTLKYTNKEDVYSRLQKTYICKN